jgi:predicted transcriptional regulator
MNSKEFISKEKLLSDLEYQLISDLIKVRKDSNYTQKQLAEEANIIRESIAKIEKQVVSPQVSTLIKILEPLGYTLKIEKIEK